VDFDPAHDSLDTYRAQTLDSLGRVQAEQLADRFKGETVKLVITSEFARARESGQIIADHLELPIETYEVLNEIGFFVRPQEIIKFERDEIKYEQAIQDVTAAGEKAVKFLENVARDHQGENVVVVCHGNIIRAIVGHALKASVESMIRMQVDLASLTMLEYDGSDLFRLMKLNDTCHLEPR
jgi:probable phosphoglycerate mutase